MNLETGICPKCHEYLLLKQKTPFLICPRCGETISAQAANAIVEKRCADPEQVNSIIAECVTLEMQYGPELPYMLLAKVVDNFPRLEKAYYLLVKMSGYEPGNVYEYLKNFAHVKSDPINVPWAESFLDTCLDFHMIDAADLFRSYVYNKIRKDRQEHYLNLIDKLVKEYTAKAADPNSTKWLMTLYTVSSVINVLLFPIMMILSGWLSKFTSLYFAANIVLGMAVVSLEVFLMYIHHKVYGNRLTMSRYEQLWMVIFLSSMVFAVGSVVMGSIWKITF